MLEGRRTVPDPLLRPVEPREALALLGPGRVAGGGDVAVQVVSGGLPAIAVRGAARAVGRAGAAPRWRLLVATKDVI